MALLFSNNASAELAAALTADATTLYVEEGKGSYFPVISRVGDYFYVTLVGDSVMEIVKVTATEGDTFTIVRAQDNTEAAAFAIGDLIELRITAADFKDILTSPKLSDFFADSSKVNPIYSTDADTYQYWSGIRGGVYYYNRAGSLVNQPSQYGLLLHCAQLAFVFQLWKALPNGDLYYRSMSDTNERDEWTKIAKDADLTALAEQINTDITTSINNLDTKIDTVSTNATTGISNLSTHVDDTFLKKSGGTMTGNLALANAYSNNNTGALTLGVGSAWDTGPCISFYGVDYPDLSGKFAIRTGTATTELVGNPGGALTWGGSQAFLPAGAVFAFAANSTPAGCLLCNGAAVSRTTYAALFAAIGTTYGTGDGSTTFNLPNLTDKFIQGSGTAGTSKSAGLPNITGSFGGLGNYNSGGTNAMSGAFYGSGASGFSFGGGDTVSSLKGYFNASRSSSIYGSSSTVQPPAVTMRFYIKY